MRQDEDMTVDVANGIRAVDLAVSRTVGLTLNRDVFDAVGGAVNRANTVYEAIGRAVNRAVVRVVDGQNT